MAAPPPAPPWPQRSASSRQASTPGLVLGQLRPKATLKTHQLVGPGERQVLGQAEEARKASWRRHRQPGEGRKGSWGRTAVGWEVGEGPTVLRGRGGERQQLEGEGRFRVVVLTGDTNCP